MDYGVIFCGGGPAGIGPIIAAAAAGKLGELLDRGVLVIEPGPVGPGGMSHYAIPANSLGGAFLEGLDSLTDPAFDSVRHAPETAALRATSEYTLHWRQSARSCAGSATRWSNCSTRTRAAACWPARRSSRWSWCPAASG